MESAPVPTVWQCGGGRQSTAIAALIVQGRLPLPDYAVMADTDRERTSTWEYMKAVLRPHLIEAGVNLVVVPKSEWTTVDVWAGADGKTCLLPVFTTFSGTLSKLPVYCSSKWKSRPIQRFLKERLGLTKWVNWFGMSLDEMRRVRQRDDKGNLNWYPLIQGIPMRASECINLVVNIMGWPEPPHSACAECPNQGNSEWRDMRKNWPADFERACLFDEWIRETDPTIFLHFSGVPLREANLEAEPTAITGQLTLSCDSGFCMV